MGRKSKGYAPEFRQQMIELVAAGRTPEKLSREFEPSALAIRNWVAQAQRDAGKRGDSLTSFEREELARLRRDVKQLQQERDILSLATAWFAREANTISPKGSRSSARTGLDFPWLRCAVCSAYPRAASMRGRCARRLRVRVRTPC